MRLSFRSMPARPTREAIACSRKMSAVSQDYGLTSYLACHGSQWATYNFTTGQYVGDGMIYYNSKTRITDALDGATEHDPSRRAAAIARRRLPAAVLGLVDLRDELGCRHGRQRHIDLLLFERHVRNSVPKSGPLS